MQLLSIRSASRQARKETSWRIIPFFYLLIFSPLCRAVSLISFLSLSFPPFRTDGRSRIQPTNQPTAHPTFHFGRRTFGCCDLSSSPFIPPYFNLSSLVKRSLDCRVSCISMTSVNTRWFWAYFFRSLSRSFPASHTCVIAV